MPVQFKCEICGTPFQRSPAKSKSEANRFCSKKCQGLGLSRENHPNWGGVRPTCRTCGKEIVAYGSRRQTAKFCSRKCQKWMTRKSTPRPTGKTAPQQYKTRPQILSRDNNACVLCGGGPKHVHHINGNWQDERCANRCSLCQACHTGVHNGDLDKLLKLLSWLVDRCHEYRSACSI